MESGTRMRKKDRKAFILRRLTEKSSVSVSELGEAFGLSGVSVRKLLDEMERDGTIRRTWGGAVGANGSLGEPSFAEKEGRSLKEKQAIARAAYDLIQDGDAVFLDSGTTTVHLARLLAAGEKRKVLVCTNALSVAAELQRAEDLQILLIGGEFRHRILSCTGSIACEALKSLFFDKGFITGNHFSLERGITTPSLAEAEVKRAVLAASKETFALIDYSKYGGDSLSLVAPISGVGTLITDWRALPETVRRLEEKGVRVFLAKPEEVIV